MQPALRLIAVLAAVAPALALTGCTTAEGASKGNFELTPERLGWYVGEEARFMLNLTPSLTRSDPDFTIDRVFAIEEIRFNERGASVGGDFKTRDPDAVRLRLVQNGTEGNEFRLTPSTPSLDLYLTLPDALRDSEYVLEVKLFKVGWVKSEPFRVDVR